MLTIVNEKVRSFSIDYLDIFWEVKSTTEDIQDYSFYVERSEAEAGPWDQIAGPLVDTFYCRDSAIPSISTNRTLFYRIKVEHNVSKAVSYSAIADRHGRPDAYASEIIKLENVMFSELTGVRSWVFPIRTFGQRCPECWDDVLQKRQSDSCRTCWRTGFSGGYHHPIQVWCQIDNPPEQTEYLSPMRDDHRQVNYFNVRMGPSPDVKPLDMIVDHLNRRFRVFSVGGTARFGVTVRQEIKCVQIQKGAIEDAIPLSVPNSLDLVPKRSFKVSSEMSNARIKDVLGLYGYK